MIDLLGNQINVMFDNLPSVIRNERLGKLRAIAETAVPGQEATSWFGMFAPAATTPAVVTKLSTALVKVLDMPRVKKAD